MKKKYKAIIYTNRVDRVDLEAILQLEDYGVHYLERRVDIQGITKEQVEILSKEAEHGVMDLIARKSNDFKRIQSRFLDMSYDELIEYISEHPSVLKTPIIYSTQGTVIGYHKDEIDNLSKLISGRRKKVVIDEW